MLTSVALSVSGEDSIHLVPGRSYRLAFVGVDTQLEGRIYEHPDLTNPIVRVTGSDAVYQEGTCGLVVYDNSGAANRTDATFDNYAATNREPEVPPQLMVRQESAGLVVISWLTNAAGYVLQTSPNLSTKPITWTDIAGAIFEREGTNEYFEFVGAAQQFYRLEKTEASPVRNARR